jgi:predicted RNase H-like HicB family nuclease
MEAKGAVDMPTPSPKPAHNESTAVYEKDGDWFIGYCPEVPGANGQGRSLDECRESLREAIALIFEDRRLAKKICRGLSAPVIGE